MKSIMIKNAYGCDQPNELPGYIYDPVNDTFTDTETGKVFDKNGSVEPGGTSGGGTSGGTPSTWQKLEWTPLSTTDKLDYGPYGYSSGDNSRPQRITVIAIDIVGTTYNGDTYRYATFFVIGQGGKIEGDPQYLFMADIDTALYTVSEDDIINKSTYEAFIEPRIRGDSDYDLSSMRYVQFFQE